MSSKFPALVIALTHNHDSWIVGSAANPNNLEFRDIDIIVPYSQWQSASALIPKDAVVNTFGGWKCNCCGEKERNFLSLDHVNNDAYKLIKEGVHPKGTTRLYAWLRRNKFPAGFQVLCMNCNFGKRMNGGMCPHQVRRNDYGASQ